MTTQDKMYYAALAIKARIDAGEKVAKSDLKFLKEWNEKYSRLPGNIGKRKPV
jgi:hypothetical protein